MEPEKWVERCRHCRRRTRHSTLDCAEHGSDCRIEYCTECGRTKYGGETCTD